MAFMTYIVLMTDIVTGLIQAFVLLVQLVEQQVFPCMLRFDPGRERVPFRLRIGPSCRCKVVATRGFLFFQICIV